MSKRHDGNTLANPGSTQGELGMLISILGFTVGLISFGIMSIIGFCISASALRKSHRAGYTNGPAALGMFLGSGPFVLAAIAFIYFLSHR
jgi:hypothetical protein